MHTVTRTAAARAAARAQATRAAARDARSLACLLACLPRHRNICSLRFCLLACLTRFCLLACLLACLSRCQTLRTCSHPCTGDESGGARCPVACVLACLSLPACLLAWLHSGGRPKSSVNYFVNPIASFGTRLAPTRSAVDSIDRARSGCLSRPRLQVRSVHPRVRMTHPAHHSAVQLFLRRAARGR